MSSVDSSDHTSSSFRSVVSAAPPPLPWTLLLLLPLPLIHYWLPVPVVPTRTTTIGGSLGLDCRTTALLRPSSDRFGDLRSLSAQERRYCGRIKHPVLVSSRMTHVPHWRIHICCFKKPSRPLYRMNLQNIWTLPHENVIKQQATSLSSLNSKTLNFPQMFYTLIFKSICFSLL